MKRIVCDSEFPRYNHFYLSPHPQTNPSLLRTITAERIGTLTGDVMEELSRLWFNIYEPEVVEKNILLLEQHVRTLFVDITSESVKRRDQLQDEVDRKYTYKIQTSTNGH